MSEATSTRLSAIGAWLQQEDDEILYAPDGHQPASAGNGWDYREHVVEISLLEMDTFYASLDRLLRCYGIDPERSYEMEELHGGMLVRVSQRVAQPRLLEEQVASSISAVRRGVVIQGSEASLLSSAYLAAQESAALAAQCCAMLASLPMQGEKSIYG